MQTEGNWSYLMKGSGFQANHIKMDFSAARNFCLERGRDLASVISMEESEEIVKVAKGKMWLGGKRNGQSGTWNWLDGRLWDFENWYTKSFYINPFGSDTQPIKLAKTVLLVRQFGAGMTSLATFVIHSFVRLLSLQR